MFIKSGKKDIILDCDDVIVDMKNVLIPALNKATGKNVQIHEQTDFNLRINFPELSYDEILDIIVKAECFTTVEVLNGAKEGIDMLKDFGFNLHVVTSRGYHPEALKLTREHLLDNNIKVDSINIVNFGQSKSEVYSKIAKHFEFIVDDHVENLYNAEKSGIVSNGVFITQPWNIKFENDKKNHRFDCLTQFAETVQREYNFQQKNKTSLSRKFK